MEELALGQVIACKIGSLGKQRRVMGIIIGKDTQNGRYSCIKVSSDPIFNNLPKVNVTDKGTVIGVYNVEPNTFNTASIVHIYDNIGSVYLNVIEFYLHILMGYFTVENGVVTILPYTYNPIRGMLYGMSGPANNVLDYQQSSAVITPSTTTITPTKISSEHAEEKKSQIDKFNERVKKFEQQKKEQQEKEEHDAVLKYVARAIESKKPDEKPSEKLDELKSKSVNTRPRLVKDNDTNTNTDNTGNINIDNIIISDQVKAQVDLLFKTYSDYAVGDALPISGIYRKFVKQKDVDFHHYNIKYFSRQYIEMIISVPAEVLVKAGVCTSASVYYLNKYAIKALIDCIIEGCDPSTKAHTSVPRKDFVNPMENTVLRDLILEDSKSNKSLKDIYRDITALEPALNCSYRQFTHCFNVYMSELGEGYKYDSKIELDGFIKRFKDGLIFGGYKNIDAILKDYKALYDDGSIVQYLDKSIIYNGTCIEDKIVFYYILYSRENNRTVYRIVMDFDDIAKWLNSHSIKEIRDAFDPSHNAAASIYYANHNFIFGKIYSHYKFAKNSEINTLKKFADQPKNLSKHLYPLMSRFRVLKNEKMKKEIENITHVSEKQLRNAVANMKHPDDTRLVDII